MKLYDRTESKKLFYKLMKIQRILDPVSFTDKFNAFLSETDAPLRDYLLKNYQNRTEKWAACFRKYMQINVNMYIESMHRLLKRTYLRGNQIRQKIFINIYILKAKKTVDVIILYKNWLK